MTSVSSLRKAPCSSQPTPDSAASTSARLVMLFDPGTFTAACGGFVSGTISNCAGYSREVSGIRHPHQKQPLRRRRRPGLGAVLGVQNLLDLIHRPEAAADVH